MPYAKLDLLRQEVKNLLEDGLIKLSLVPKQDGTMRMCFDYRHLNKVTRPDPFPMPRMDDLIDRIGNVQYISTLDLSKGYYQVPVHPDSIGKTAFVTP